GIPGAPRHMRVVRTPAGGRLVEVPPSTLRMGNLVVPFGGGGYLRLFPGRWTSWAIRRLNDRERMPAIVYVHPWETDPGQPRVSAPLKSRLRHYVGLGTTLAKLGDLASSFRFGTVRASIDATPSLPEEAVP